MRIQAILAPPLRLAQSLAVPWIWFGSSSDGAVSTWRITSRSEQTLFAKTDESRAPDDNVVHHGDPQEITCLGRFFREVHIGVGRGRVAGGVVMNQDDRFGASSHRLAEAVGEPDDGRVAAALIDEGHTEHVVLHVEHDDAELLLRQVDQFGTEIARDVYRIADDAAAAVRGESA